MSTSKAQDGFLSFFRIGYLRNILLVSLLVTTALPAYDAFYIYPSFTRQLVRNTEDDAVRVAQYLTGELLGDVTEINYEYETIKNFDKIRRLLDDFGLMKVKLFSDKGEIIYSTEPGEIGRLNKNNYFFKEVAKGNVYTKYIRKNGISAEGQRFEADVVETYVPIRKEKKFIGAFELYYDISKRKAELDGLYRKSSVVLAGMAVIFLLTILLVLNNLAKTRRRRRQALQELEESEARFRDISFSMADWVWEVDAEGRYTFSSGNSKKVIGYGQKELIGKTPFDFMPEDEAESIRKKFGEILSGRKPIVDLMNWNLKKDGTRVCLLTNGVPVYDADGEFSGYRGVDKDITDSYLAERVLRESEKKHRTIMDTCADPFVVYDNKGHVTYMNPAFTEIFGWTSEELAGKRIDFVPEEAVPETQKAIKAVFDGENLTWFESRRLTRDGRVLDVRIGAAMLRDEGGAPAGIVVNLQDITAQKQTQAELEGAKKAAEAASRAKSEFLANMSHEIRTPMNGIIGMTELTLDTDLNPEQREYLNMAKMSADSLLALINDILDFSKIEAEKLELETIDFNLRNTLENAADTLALKAHEKGLELACHIRPDVPSALIGDPGRLRQIIVNLAGNSLKFTGQGEVVLRVETEAESDGSVLLHFMVSDTGIGIPKDKLGSIFESFEQVDGSTTRKYGGTGLGLSISRQLVELMGGRIWVESPNPFQMETGSELKKNGQSPTAGGRVQGGPGSIFHFTAPFKVGSPQPAGFLPVDRQALSGLHVLVVDDNYTNRVLLLEMLAAWSLDPSAAVGGEEALAMADLAVQSGNPYRLVLLDMQMPGMDGFEVARRIKTAPSGAGMKIIMLSSVGLRGDALRCRDAGISGYLSKPVKQTDLLDTIMMTMGLGDETKPAVITSHTVQEARERLTILLAEDNAINQTLAIKLLESRGHRVILAQNGKEAVDAFLKGDIDLILMDVQMPEMDGFEATGRIRELNRENASVPIVAMTAHAMKGDRERCLAAGMDDYVTKPIDPKALFDVIHKVTRGLREKDPKKPLPAANRSGPLSPETFDLERAMETVLGNRELFREIAAMFLDGLPGYMAQIGEAIDGGDGTALNRAAHSLKGAVGNFGADRAVEAAYHLEKLGKNEELDRAAAGLSTLEDVIGALSDEMQTVLKEMKHEGAHSGR